VQRRSVRASVRAILIAVRGLLALLACFSAFGQTLLIRNVTVVDANGARPRSNVLIRGTKIFSVGTRRPAATRTIDGTDKFLIPGLWDMHVHLWDQDPMLGLYVANGVLGVRDMGSDLARTRGLRSDIAAGRIAGPLIYTGALTVDGPGSENTRAPVITVLTPEDGRRAVDRVDESLADFVTVMSRVSADAYNAIAQRARVRRIPFAGPLPEAVEATTAIDARQRSIEHLFGIALACSPHETELRRLRAEAIANRDYSALREIRQRTYSTFSPAIAGELFRRMARYGVWQTPTLTLRRRLSFIDVEKTTAAPELRYVPATVRAEWKDPREEFRKATPEQIGHFREDYDFHSKLTSHMRGSGTGILAGTDTGDPYVVPGFALHDELALLVEAGLSPAEAVAAATLQPARYFGIESEFGTVDRGKTADLVLLDKDPLQDIRNTRRIAAVIQKGHLLERKCLDAVLAGSKSPCALVPPAPKRKAAPPRRRVRRGR
jgi:hypothetical protein